jgi:hypothetical protein
MKRTSAERPRRFDTTSKTLDQRKNWSSADDDGTNPILVLVVACLIFAIIVLCTPNSVVLTTDQISLMPGWGP